MSSQITVFLDKHADARGSGALGALWLYSDGKQSTSVTLQFPSGTPLADQVKAAESLLRGVQRWRDDLVAYDERQRTAQDELVEARAEIARLKAEAGEGE
ncbi:hypothetical protein NMG29_06450 [Streptomyces cocklensis]|uniref:Uncharacterized protein n=1 Tax=Actinacidiphila cocklensis TaxID=887465 RepID=A0A9W4E4L6_9ACTN|nr:hypothetical protein [Actinacidiphila cocklensis]MDD1057871.1 hypothetical protein [Actinacidiphila cocklensis]CAG6392732.1 conserved hypothetical protein [Actinacidiphila cocklensis]